MKKILRDAIYGLAVGDAVGVPYEFKARDSFECTDMIGYGTHNQPAGTWSDDTSMTLATCASIKNCHRVDCGDIRKQFEQWLFHNEYTADGKVFDYGYTCSEAIYNKKGASDIRSNGNGSLMRILPLAFVDDVTEEVIQNVSGITHAHPISVEGCSIYVNIVKDLINGKKLEDVILRHIRKESVYHRILQITELSRNEIRSSGYVVDTLEAAIWSLMTTDNYKDCILTAVKLGEDTDTVAAVAGGLAGIIYGYKGIPKNWIDALRNKQLLEECLF